MIQGKNEKSFLPIIERKYDIVKKRNNQRTKKNSKRN